MKSIKFIKIGEVVLPKGKFDYYGLNDENEDNDNGNYCDQINELQDESDLLLITLHDGETFFAGETNMLLGLCDDCVEDRYSETVAKVEGFKKED